MPPTQGVHLKTFKFAMVITLLLASFVAFAGERCNTLENCINKVSTLTSTPYFWTDKNKMKEKVVLSENFNIDKKNADSFLSRLLFDKELTRIKYKDGFQIIHARDIRYNVTPILTLDEFDKSEKNDDYIMLSLQMDHEFETTDFARALRPFMTRYGRIVSNGSGKKIIFLENGNNISRLLEVIKGLKRTYSKKEIKEFNKRSSKIKRLEEEIKSLKKQISMAK